MQSPFISMVLFLLIQMSFPWGSISPNIYIGGLFELSDTPVGITYGQSELAAAQLAIRHINQQRILPGYKLHMFYNDTKVGHSVNTIKFFFLWSYCNG